MQRAGVWQMARVTEDGVVHMSTPPTGAAVVKLPQDRWNVGEVAWALLYHGVRFDRTALDRARAVHQRREAVVTGEVAPGGAARP